MNTPFYEWRSFFDKELIGLICKKCAVREMFGSKYKQNSSYKRWLEKEKNDTSK